LEVVRPDSAGALRAPDYIDARVLASNIAESHSLPAGAKFVVFSATDDFWANYAATAAIPAADITDGTASEFNPITRYVGSGVSAISLIAPRACIVTMAFFTE
jgi:hypothetical protein